MLDLRTRPSVAEPVPGVADPDHAAKPYRGGSAALWALLGVLALVLCTQTWGRWILSPTEFSPAPILGPDSYPLWREVALRATEVLSAVEMTVLVVFAFVLPLRRTGRLGIDAKIALGCLLGSVTDGILNMHQYLFAWNAHSVNMGSWASFLPLASDDHQSRYAEALIWGIPMYTYFCIGVAIAACALIKRWRRRWPKLSNVRALAMVFGLAFVFDFVLENIIIRLDHAYAFAKTPAEITLWAGGQYQFPLYESVSVAALGVAFTALRLSALDSADGRSFVERGSERFRPGLQGPVRWLAVIGFAVSMLFLIYHLPFNWFGTNGDSLADLPSYMLPGD